MNSLYQFSVKTFCFIILGMITIPVLAQDRVQKAPDLLLEKGTILTSFSVDWVKASRDAGYNHEFEHGFDRLSYTLDGLYFINENIGVGPLLGYQYVYRDFETRDGSFTPDDIQEWNFEYGMQAGYYSPVKEVFKTDALGNSRLFVTGGVSWLRNQRKMELVGEKFDPVTEFGYAISTGILVPLGKNVGLEWRLKWEARAREYQQGYVDQNNNVVITGSETKWPSVISLGIGLKLGF